VTAGFFHVARGETPHVALAAAMIQSVREAMPTVEIVHLTDMATAPIEGADRVRRHAPAPIALGCLEAYAACEGEWLFIDTDVIVQSDVRFIFSDATFDVAVATREGTLRPKEVGTKFMAGMPYNKGVVFSRSPDFWAAAAERLRTLSAKRQEWMGDQVAMCHVIAAGGFRVEVLPARYNYPPQRSDEDVTGQAILHYKGSRKPWMLQPRACTIG
jgi:hypothetical protein